MGELRAADPTLDGLTGPVGVDLMAPHPAVAHATLNGGIEAQTRCGLRCHDLLPAVYARWFAVPCRDCFPEAGPPGCPSSCMAGLGCDYVHEGLAWQVREAADG